MTDLIKAIERGKQRGCSKLLVIDGIKYWIDIAIQKYEQKYYVHYSKIKEENMAQELFEEDYIKEFTVLDKALDHLKAHSEISLEQMSALKGQKLFDPKHFNSGLL